MAWPKGVSGNPAGRPKEGTGLMDIIRREISHEDITQALKKLLFAGDPKIPQYLADRELGRPAQSLIVSGDAEKPLHMLVGVEGRDLTPQLAQGAQEALPAPTEAHCLDDLEGEVLLPSTEGDGWMALGREG